MRSRLEAYADGAGRLAGLKAGSWDARAKRVLDAGAAVASSSGQALLTATEDQLGSAKSGLDNELKERGEENVESLTKERLQWAKDGLRLAWLSWCARLLRKREGLLLKEGDEANDAADKTSGLGLHGVLEALV